MFCFCGGSARTRSLIPLGTSYFVRGYTKQPAAPVRAPLGYTAGPCSSYSHSRVGCSVGYTSYNTCYAVQRGDVFFLFFLSLSPHPPNPLRHSNPREPCGGRKKKKIKKIEPGEIFTLLSGVLMSSRVIPRELYLLSVFHNNYKYPPGAAL